MDKRYCPHLGKSKLNPNQVMCGKLDPPSPVRVTYARTYCLAAYTECSIYKGAPGRQSRDDSSPLVVVPVKPQGRSASTAEERRMAAEIAPKVEFVAYEDDPPLEIPRVPRANARLVPILAGVVVVLLIVVVVLVAAQLG